MAYDYFNDSFKELNKTVKNRGYDYRGMTLQGVINHIDKLDEGVRFVHIDNILVNKTIHSQYFYDIKNPEPVYNKIQSQIEDLEKTLVDLKKAKKSIIRNSTNKLAKKRLNRKELLIKLNI